MRRCFPGIPGHPFPAGRRYSSDPYWPCPHKWTGRKHPAPSSKIPWPEDGWCRKSQLLWTRFFSDLRQKSDKLFRHIPDPSTGSPPERYGYSAIPAVPDPSRCPGKGIGGRGYADRSCREWWVGLHSPSPADSDIRPGSPDKRPGKFLRGRPDSPAQSPTGGSSSLNNRYYLLK